MSMYIDIHAVQSISYLTIVATRHAVLLTFRAD